MAGEIPPKLKSVNVDRKGGKQGRKEAREEGREEGNRWRKMASTSVAFLTVHILMFPH